MIRTGTLEYAENFVSCPTRQLRDHGDTTLNVPVTTLT